MSQTFDKKLEQTNPSSRRNSLSSAASQPSSIPLESNHSTQDLLEKLKKLDEKLSGHAKKSKKQEQSIYLATIRLAKHLNKRPEDEKEQRAKKLYKLVFALSARFDKDVQEELIRIINRTETEAFYALKLSEVAGLASDSFDKYFKVTEVLRDILRSLVNGGENLLARGLSSADHEVRNFTLSLLFNQIFPLLRIAKLPADINGCLSDVLVNKVATCGVKFPGEKVLKDAISLRFFKTPFQYVSDIINNARTVHMNDVGQLSNYVVATNVDKAYQERSRLQTEWQGLSLKFCQIEALPANLLLEKITALTEIELDLAKRKFTLYVDVLKALPGNEQDPLRRDLLQQLQRLHQKITFTEGQAGGVEDAKNCGSSYQGRIKAMAGLEKIHKKGEVKEDNNIDLQVLREKAIYLRREMQVLIKQKNALVGPLQKQLQNSILSQKERNQYGLLLAEHFYLDLLQRADEEGSIHYLQQEHDQCLSPLVASLSKITGIVVSLSSIDIDPLDLSSNDAIKPYYQVAIFRKKLLTALTVDLPQANQQQRAVILTEIATLKQALAKNIAQLMSSGADAKLTEAKSISTADAERLVAHVLTPQQRAWLMATEAPEKQSLIKIAADAATHFAALETKPLQQRMEELHAADIALDQRQFDSIVRLANVAIEQLSQRKGSARQLEMYRELLADGDTIAVVNFKSDKPAMGLLAYLQYLDKKLAHAGKASEQRTQALTALLEKAQKVAEKHDDNIATKPDVKTAAAVPEQADKLQLELSGLLLERQEMAAAWSRAASDLTEAMKTATPKEQALYAGLLFQHITGNLGALDDSSNTLQRFFTRNAWPLALAMNDASLRICAAVDALLAEKNKHLGRRPSQPAIATSQPLTSQRRNSEPLLTPQQINTSASSQSTVFQVARSVETMAPVTVAIDAIVASQWTSAGGRAELKPEYQAVVKALKAKSAVLTASKTLAQLESTIPVGMQPSGDAKAVAPAPRRNSIASLINRRPSQPTIPTQQIVDNARTALQEAGKAHKARLAEVEAEFARVQASQPKHIPVAVVESKPALVVETKATVSVEPETPVRKKSSATPRVTIAPSPKIQALIERLNRISLDTPVVAEIQQPVAETVPATITAMPIVSEPVVLSEIQPSVVDTVIVPAATTMPVAESTPIKPIDTIEQSEPKQSVSDILPVASTVVLEPVEVKASRDDAVTPPRAESKLVRQCAEQLLEFVASRMEKFPLNQSNIIEHTESISCNTKLLAILDRLMRFFEHQEQPATDDIADAMLQLLDGLIVSMVMASGQSELPAEINQQLRAMSSELLQHAEQVGSFLKDSAAKDLHAEITALLKTNLIGFLKPEAKDQVRLESTSSPSRSISLEQTNNALEDLQRLITSPHIKKALSPIAERSDDFNSPALPNIVKLRMLSARLSEKKSATPQPATSQVSAEVVVPRVVKILASPVTNSQEAKSTEQPIPSLLPAPVDLKVVFKENVDVVLKDFETVRQQKLQENQAFYNMLFEKNTGIFKVISNLKLIIQDKDFDSQKAGYALLQVAACMAGIFASFQQVSISAKSQWLAHDKSFGCLHQLLGTLEVLQGKSAFSNDYLFRFYSIVYASVKSTRDFYASLDHDQHVWGIKVWPEFKTLAEQLKSYAADHQHYPEPMRLALSQAHGELVKLQQDHAAELNDYDADPYVFVTALIKIVSGVVAGLEKCAQSGVGEEAIVRSAADQLHHYLHDLHARLVINAMLDDALLGKLKELQNCINTLRAPKASPPQPVETGSREQVAGGREEETTAHLSNSLDPLSPIPRDAHSPKQHDSIAESSVPLSPATPRGLSAGSNVSLANDSIVESIINSEPNAAAESTVLLPEPVAFSVTPVVERALQSPADQAASPQSQDISSTNPVSEVVSSLLAAPSPAPEKDKGLVQESPIFSPIVERPSDSLIARILARPSPQPETGSREQVAGGREEEVAEHLSPSTPRGLSAGSSSLLDAATTVAENTSRLGRDVRPNEFDSDVATIVTESPASLGHDSRPSESNVDTAVTAIENHPEKKLTPKVDHAQDLRFWFDVEGARTPTASPEISALNTPNGPHTHLISPASRLALEEMSRHAAATPVVIQPTTIVAVDHSPAIRVFPSLDDITDSPLAKGNSPVLQDSSSPKQVIAEQKITENVVSSPISMVEQVGTLEEEATSGFVPSPLPQAQDPNIDATADNEPADEKSIANLPESTQIIAARTFLQYAQQIIEQASNDSRFDDFVSGLESPIKELQAAIDNQQENVLKNVLDLVVSVIDSSMDFVNDWPSIDNYKQMQQAMESLLAQLRLFESLIDPALKGRYQDLEYACAQFIADLQKAIASNSLEPQEAKHSPQVMSPVPVQHLPLAENDNNDLSSVLMPLASAFDNDSKTMSQADDLLASTFTPGTAIEAFDAGVAASLAELAKPHIPTVSVVPAHEDPREQKRPRAKKKLLFDSPPSTPESIIDLLQARVPSPDNPATTPGPITDLLPESVPFSDSLPSAPEPVVDFLVPEPVEDKKHSVPGDNLIASGLQSPPDISRAVSPTGWLEGDIIEGLYADDAKGAAPLKEDHKDDSFRNRAFSIVSSSPQPPRIIEQYLIETKELKAPAARSIFAIAAAGDLDAVRAFLEHAPAGFDINARDKQGYTVSMYAAANGHDLVVGEFLKAVFPGTEAANQIHVTNSRTALMLAVERFTNNSAQGRNYGAVISRLLLVPGIDVKQTYPDGSSLLMRAIKLGQVELVVKLLRHESMPNSASALQQAVRCQDIAVARAMVRALLSARRVVPIDYQNALLLAVQRGDHGLVGEFRLNRAPANALQAALSRAIRCQDVELIKLFRRRHAAVDPAEFVTAAARGQWDICRALLCENNFNLFQPPINVQTLELALLHAVNQASPQNQAALFAIQLLRHLGANPAAALTRAVERGDANLILTVFQPPAINGLVSRAVPAENASNVALRIAIARQDIASISRSLDEGADIHHRPQADQPISLENPGHLLFAIRGRHYLAAHYLIQRGARLTDIQAEWLPAVAPNEDDALRLLRRAHEIAIQQQVNVDVSAEPPVSRAAVGWNGKTMRRVGEAVFWAAALFVLGLSVAALSVFSLGLPAFVALLLPALPYLMVAFTVLSSMMLNFALTDDINSNWEYVFLNLWSEVEGRKKVLRITQTLAQHRPHPTEDQGPMMDAVDARNIPNDFIVLPAAPEENSPLGLKLNPAQRNKLLHMANSALNALMAKGEGDRIANYPVIPDSGLDANGQRNADIQQLWVLQRYLSDLQSLGGDGRNEAVILATLNNVQFRAAYLAFKGSAHVDTPRDNYETILGRLRGTTLHPKTMMDGWFGRQWNSYWRWPRGGESVGWYGVKRCVMFPVMLLALPYRIVTLIDRGWQVLSAGLRKISKPLKTWFNSPTYASNDEYQPLLENNDGARREVKNGYWLAKNIVKFLYYLIAYAVPLTIVGLLLFAVTTLLNAMFNRNDASNKLIEWLLDKWEGSISDEAIRHSANTVAPAAMGIVGPVSALLFGAFAKNALAVEATSYDDFKPVRDKLLHDQEVRCYHFDAESAVDFGWKNNILLYLSAATFGLSEVLSPKWRPYRVCTGYDDAGKPIGEVPTNLTGKQWLLMAIEYYDLSKREGRRNALLSAIKLSSFIYILTMSILLTVAGAAVVVSPASWALTAALLVFVIFAGPLKALLAALVKSIATKLGWPKPMPADQSLVDFVPGAAPAVQQANAAVIPAAQPQATPAVPPEPNLVAPQQPLLPLTCAQENRVVSQQSRVAAINASFMHHQPSRVEPKPLEPKPQAADESESEDELAEELGINWHADGEIQFESRSLEVSVL